MLMKRVSLFALWVGVFGASHGFADIGIDWNEDQYAVVYRQDSKVKLALCQGDLPEIGGVSRRCLGGTVSGESSFEAYAKSLRALHKIPAEYQQTDGLTKVSAEHERKKRILDQAADTPVRHLDRLLADIDRLGKIQKQLREIQHGLLDLLDDGRSASFHRRYHVQWGELMASFSPVWWAGKRWLRLTQGTWQDQESQCFSPWYPLPRVHSEGLSDAIRLHIMAGQPSQQVWIKDDAAPDPIWYAYPNMTGSASRAFRSTSADKSQFGNIIDISKYEVGEDDYPITHATITRSFFGGTSVGYQPAYARYEGDRLSKAAVSSILCVLEESRQE